MVAYDGAAFHGFAANPGVPTVAGSLDGALARVLGRDIRVTCAGRTDAGVHAQGQVISFDGPAELDTGGLQHSINRMLGPSIAVRELSAAHASFDARFSARSRTYRYRVLNRDVPDPFLAATAWHVTAALDVEAMTAAGRDLVGEHDFSSFCRRRTVAVDGRETEADLTREVLDIEWRRGPDGVVDHWISATAFCHQMVRSITGTLVEVGLGKRARDSMPEVLAARDRHAAGALAPPHGLTLWSVGY